MDEKRRQNYYFKKNSNTYPCDQHFLLFWRLLHCWIFISVNGAKWIRLNTIIRWLLVAGWLVSVYECGTEWIFTFFFVLVFILYLQKKRVMWVWHLSKHDIFLRECLCSVTVWKLKKGTSIFVKIPKIQREKRETDKIYKNYVIKIVEQWYCWISYYTTHINYVPMMDESAWRTKVQF